MDTSTLQQIADRLDKPKSVIPRPPRRNASNDERPCSRCGEGERVYNSSWCGPCKQTQTRAYRARQRAELRVLRTLVAECEHCQGRLKEMMAAVDDEVA